MNLNNIDRVSNARICIPLSAKTFGELERLAERAVSVADMIEFRLDCLDEQELINAHENIRRVIQRLSVPVIITFRPSEEGGYRDISLEQRRQFWERLEPVNAFFDIEEDLCSSREFGLTQDWSRVICSHHDFGEVPQQIDDLYERLAATRAGILKIAGYANDTAECLSIFKLLSRAANERRKLIALAMGDGGVCTRILGPSLGSFVTYATLEEGTGTAPGQVTAERMKSVFRISEINRHTNIFGLIGSPVMHSISPDIHNAAFEANGIDAVYLPFEVKDLRSFMNRMVHPSSRELDWPLMGLSVTAPHKLDVMQYLDSVEPLAQEIGAVNTVVVDGEAMRGYNTDVVGFIEPLSAAIDLKPGLRVAVLGAGGAANAAVWSLKQKEAEVVLFARDVHKGRSLAQRFDASCESLNSASFAEFDVVINATPLGSSGARANETAAIADQLRGVRLAYDLVYNPIETRFMREAKDAGCKTLGGLDMLVAQAKLQFKLWTGRDAPASVMREAALRGLTQV